MAKLDEIINLIRDMNTPYLKIHDGRNNLLYTIDSGDSGAEESINKLQKLKDFFTPYGRVNITAATPTMKKQSWANAFKWELDFFNTGNANLPVPQNFNFAQPGMMSIREAELLAENKQLKADQEWNRRFDELNKKIDGAKKEDQFLKYLPMAGLVLDIDQKRIDAVMKLASLGNAMGGGQQGMAGLNNTQQQIKTTVEGTPEEKIKMVEKLMSELSSKVEIDKIIVLLTGLNNNPAFADQAIAFLNIPK